jgi:hypothetical protein
MLVGLVLLIGGVFLKFVLGECVDFSVVPRDDHTNKRSREQRIEVAGS